ncbi:MAG TPA: class I SAM-dependent methyltransferase [Anaerolineae bacterium]|nr:class I SAM-dependent methyltransferase [Anaerolineae bacterium]
MDLKNDYEYRGLIASTWDLFLGNEARWEDTLFFRELISRHGQPVLEIGCGTGRLLLDYLAAGIIIDGVDNSPEMLAICRDKAQQHGLQPALFQQAMEQLDLPRRYRTVIIPASSFQLVTDPAMARQAMQRFLAHLEPGGILAMRLMIPWQEGKPRQTGWRLTGEVVRPEDRAVLRRWSRASYEVETQLEHTEDRYEVILQGEIIASEHHWRSPAGRWYTPAQALSLFEEAGFTQVCLSGGWSDKEPIFTVSGKKS